MNVLLIHQAFVSGQEAGGTRHYEFGQRLATHGDRLTVVASQVNYLTGERVQPGRRGVLYREQHDGVTVLRAYAPPVLHRSFFWRVLAFIIFALSSIWGGLRAGPVDVVMGTTPPIFQAISALIVARLRRKPFLLEVRDLWPEFAISMGVLKNPLAQWTGRRLESFLYRHADFLMVNSPAYRDYLIAKNVPAARIGVIANGVDPSAFDPEARGETIRERFGLAEKFLLVYAGAHGMANDLGVVLRAAARLRDDQTIHFLFVGDGKERGNLEREARALGLTNVTFAGPLPKAAMPEVLAAADVCVATLMDIPMFNTTYPNKVFDYMAAGRPTILAIDGVIRAVIEAADGGCYVHPGDDEALANAVSTLQDEEKRRRMGRAARVYVEEHFHRATQADDFRQLLAQMIIEKQGKAVELPR